MATPVVTRSWWHPEREYVDGVNLFTAPVRTSDASVSITLEEIFAGMPEVEPE